MKTQSLGRFQMGNGAMRSEGAPVKFELANCEPVFYIRALDALALAELAEAGVDLAAVGINPDEETVLSWMARNASQFSFIVSRLVVKFDGLRRADGTVIECNEQTIAGLAGYPQLVGAIIRGGFDVAMELEGNSAGSSDGNGTPSALPGGEPINETAA